MQTKEYKSTQIINHIISTTTKDKRMIEVLKAYIQSSYHQGIHFYDVQRFGIGYYQAFSSHFSRCWTHLRVYFGNGGYTEMSLKKLKRWCRVHCLYIENLFQTSYDKKIKDRIWSIIDQYANDSQDRERLLQIWKVSVQDQHAIDLQRAWKLFQEHATYIHPRTGKVTSKMNLFQFTKQMEQEWKQ